MTCSFCDKYAYTTLYDNLRNKYYLCTDHVKKIKTIDFEEN